MYVVCKRSPRNEPPWRRLARSRFEILRWSFAKDVPIKLPPRAVALADVKSAYVGLCACVIDPLLELLRRGAKKLIEQALSEEFEPFLERYADPARQ